MRAPASAFLILAVLLLLPAQLALSETASPGLFTPTGDPTRAVAQDQGQAEAILKQGRAAEA